MANHSDPTSVMGRRIGAVMIDGLVVFVPTVIAFSTQMESFDYGSAREARNNCTAYNEIHESGICVNAGSTIYFTQDAGPAPLILLGLSFAVFVLLQGLTGWTLGKLAAGIRTVQEDGTAPGIGRALVRWLFWIVDSLPFAWLVGIITSLTSTGHRRVGDMVAKTYVVRADAMGSPIRLDGTAAVGPVAAEAATTPWATPGTPPPPSARPGPQWDAARDTYIQWDPDAREWMQWDDAAKRWDVIAAAPVDPPPPPPPPPPG